MPNLLNHSCPLVAACCLALCFVAGCERNTQETDGQEATFAGYADLPGLQASHDPNLKREYALLVAQRATPKMLDEDAAQQVLDDAVDLRLVLDEQFNPSALEYAMQRTDRMFDGPQLRWDSVNLVQASQFAQQYEQQRLTVRKALTHPHAYVSLPLSHGVGLKVEFIDAAYLYHRLETFRAADQLTTSDLDGALATLRLMFRLQSIVGAQQHVVARLTAARCRRESLGVVQAIASNSATDTARWNKLREMIDEQLAAWPSDAAAWIGDRAQGLHMYEMIRDGHLLSVLTGDELAQLSQDRSLPAFTAAATKSIDLDEAFYLRCMRELIAACEQPYHQRAATFAALRSELAELQKSAEYPLIADRLLLQGIEQGQQQQALDRAWMEAWSNALALAVADDEPAYSVNTLTGREYGIEYEHGRVIVSRIDPHDFQSRVAVELRRAARLSSGTVLPPPK